MKVAFTGNDDLFKKDLSMVICLRSLHRKVYGGGEAAGGGE